MLQDELCISDDPKSPNLLKSEKVNKERKSMSLKKTTPKQGKRSKNVLSPQLAVEMSRNTGGYPISA